MAKRSDGGANKASRRKSRQRAVQILFQVDLRGGSPSEALSGFYESLYSEENEEKPVPDEFLEQLVQGVCENRAALDERLQKYSEHWKVERMSAVDRNILRLAAYEILFTKTPPPVAIDEAIEIARRFSGDESVGFINGLLDTLRKDAGPELSLPDTEG